MRRLLATFIFCFYCCTLGSVVFAWSPMAVSDDPLVRMPGTQPEQGVVFQSPAGNDPACLACHGEDPDDVVPGFYWQGSMMAQAARDPFFWATLTVALQDSIWAVGNPNAGDICLRCHTPEGWLGGRSDPVNGSALTGSDFDGVHCDFCHNLYDPFFETTFDGSREGNDWSGYWDEAGPLSQQGADGTLAIDRNLALQVPLMAAGEFFYQDVNNQRLPRFGTYPENGGGQYFVSDVNAFAQKRGPFADAIDTSHEIQGDEGSIANLYSRYHKSKYFCATCHDVSNPVLANAGLSDLEDNSDVALITEQHSAFSYFHVERTFSEFMASAYGQQGGAPTNPEFQAMEPTVTHAAKCQDCHMKDIEGRGASGDLLIRPTESTEHPASGAPLHDFQGGNIWVTRILASLDSNNGQTYDQTNFSLLTREGLTPNLDDGISPKTNSAPLLAAVERARGQLQMAATLKDVGYDPVNGVLSFRLQNNTGHKLLSGYPEGRRMFVNVRLYQQDQLVYEINPFDDQAATLKGLHYWNYDGAALLPDPAGLTGAERYEDPLVYEAHPMSSLTGEAEQTFHFALASGRYKDNRIPPRGFRLLTAEQRLCQPVHEGTDDRLGSATNLYSSLELAAGTANVSIAVPPGADRVEVSLYYQGVSREYVEFLRDEINATGANRMLYGPDNVLNGNDQTFASVSGSNPDNDNAYLIQADPFFTGLRDWGDIIWELWANNLGLDIDGAGPDSSGEPVAGITPFLMTSTMATLNAGLDTDGDGLVDAVDPEPFAAFGVQKIGTFRNGVWLLDADGNGSWNSAVDQVFSFGQTGDIPVIGDWDNSGTDKFGVFRNGTWYLDANGNRRWDSAVDGVFRFGQSGDLPAVGDWNGDGTDQFGVFRNGVWYLDTDGDGTWNPAVDQVVSFGMAGDLPVVGDWNNDGIDNLGVFRSGRWYFDSNGNRQWDPATDTLLSSFGMTGDVPLIGDWTGGEAEMVGVFRQGRWYFDSNNNAQWDTGVDRSLTAFGLGSDIPIVGVW